MSIEEEVANLWISIRTLTSNLEVAHGIVYKLEERILSQEKLAQGLYRMIKELHKDTEAKRQVHPHWSDLPR